jgi:drug/metabolite transporter (DMT)-like permease
LTNRFELKAPKTLLGIGIILLGAFCWAASDIASQYLTDSLPAIQITWLRYVVMLLIMMPWMRRGVGLAVKTRYLKLHIFRALSTVASAALFIFGLGYMPIADATAVTFIQPIIIMALAILFLGEKVDLARWLAACVGLIGVLIIVQPGSSAFQWAALLPLGAASVYSFAVIITRLMVDEPAEVTMLYTAFVGTLVLSVLTLFDWVVPSLQDLALSVVAGGFAAAANFMVLIAYRLAPASNIAPFTYSQLIWASGLGFLAFGVWPTALTLIGAAIIAGSGIYLANRERIDAKQII